MIGTDLILYLKLKMSEFLIRRNTVLETLRGSRRKILGLWVQQGLGGKEIAPILTAARARQVPIQTESKQFIGQLAGDSSHQGVLLKVGPYIYADLDSILGLAESRREKPFLLLFLI